MCSVYCGRDSVLAAVAQLGYSPSTLHGVDELAVGQLRNFADWPDEQVPRRTAGVYTVWRGEEFLYVGMSGRGAQSEDFTAQTGAPGGAKGLWTRLNSHASGRRSGDQFNVYICDRFVVPALAPDQQPEIGHGRLSPGCPSTR